MSSVWYKSTLLTSQSVHTNKKILNREIKNTDRNSISNFFISVSKTYLRFCLPAFRPPDLRSFSLRSLVIALKFS